MSHLSELLAHLPETPGVYCMKNQNKRVIYVGKSVNLKSRVNSYWSDTRNLNFAKQSMIAQVRDVEIFETQNELEALVLETNLIKEWKPKYNILMKDDKNLGYIRITPGQVPEVVKARSKQLPGTYFGPYTAGVSMGEILKILKRLFHIRSCRVEFISPHPNPLPGGEGITPLPSPPGRGAGGEGLHGLRIGNKAGRSIPCIDHYIGICPAPCTLEPAKVAEYQKNIEHLKSFLSGKSVSVIEELRTRMTERARALEFEEAQKIKLQIEQITKLGTKQIARDALVGDYDILMGIEKYGKIFFGITEVRAGEIVGIYHSEADNKLDESFEEVLEFFIVRRYFDEANVFPKHLSLILRNPLANTELRGALKSRHISIEVPIAGSKYEMCNFTEYNLTTYAYREEMKELSYKSISRTTQVAIMERLGYNLPPWQGGAKGGWKNKELVFECYDISHLAGQFTVASRSVIVNGKSDTDRYRKYKIKTLADGKIDDFASLKEVLSRRVLEAYEQDNWPDLIVIDGGKWQLSSVMHAIREAVFDYNADREESEKKPLPHLNICSLAKREEEVFIPSFSDPVLFEKGTPELMLFQKIRDEAHRFAIGFNRASRNKAMKKNILEELPGFGPTTRKKLLKLSGSVDQIASVPREELMQILTKPQYQTLVDHGIVAE